MRSLLKKIWNFVTHMQVTAVFLAFLLMIILSYSFMGGIERRHLLKDINNAMSGTNDYILSGLHEPETTLGVIAETIRGMLISGYKREIICEYIIYINNYIQSGGNRRMEGAAGCYGIFDVFGGELMTEGGIWTPPEDFDHESLPWYTAAVKAGGKTGISQPYLDIASNDISVSFSRRIFDENGNPLGIIGIDIIINSIIDFAVDTYIPVNGYGVLFDSGFNVIVHPQPSSLGKHLTQMNDGGDILNGLLQGREISERKVKDYNGDESVLFMRRLDNGWYLAIAAYSDIYFKSIKEIGIIISLLGLALAVSLSLILLNIIASKKKTEDRVQIMFDATPLTANFWNKELKLVDCNQEAVKLFEMSGKKEYLDKFFDLSPEYQPDGKLSREKAVEYVRKAFDEGRVCFEWLHRKLNGELIPCEITLIRIVNKNENIVCGYSRDLREMKAMLAKMREADECTQVLFDATPLSCFMIDNANRILECNQEIVRLFGLSNKKEYIDRFFDFFPEYQPSGDSSRDKIIKYVYEAFEEGYCNFEWIHQKLDGEQIPTEVFLVRVKYKGVYAVAGYIRDLRGLKTMIAEMHRAEIAEESNRAKSDFLAKMSHEIRTPMNAILGIAEIQLQDSALSLEQKEALERIYNSGDLLLGIINDILDLSKIEAGKLELNKTQYDIASLIHDIVKLNIIRYESKPIDFKLNVSENIPTLLVGDELRIKQILNNLLSNAFKYTDEGRIELTFFTEGVSNDSGIMLVIQVSDTGQGMTAEQLKRLGDKYSRFNTETNTRTEGTGLGMNITRNLIHLMNGNIHIESVPGAGSTFTVRLPQGVIDPKPLGKELAGNLMKLNFKNTAKIRNLQITQEFMPYGRVLIVDDVETNLYVARGLMSSYGLSIETVLSGFEAIDKIREGAVYDIIFMDHMMPRMDGIEAVKIIRSLGYSRPVVALTANAISGQAEMFLDNGFDEFISKPIDIRQLNIVLNRFVRDKQPPEVIEEARRKKINLYASGSHNIPVDSQLSEFFVRDAQKAAGILTAIYENNCSGTDDIPAFIINIHSMKSALANIGENELSERAAKLEQAGRNHNVDLILPALPGFLESLYQVIERLSPSDDGDSQKNNGADNPGMPYLQEKLDIIQKACESFDKKTAKDALAALKQKTWPKKVKEQLSDIAECLLHSEFDEACAIAKEISY